MTLLMRTSSNLIPLAGENNVLPLALKMVDKCQGLPREAIDTCQAILNITLPHLPNKRLPRGWKEVHSALGNEA